MNYDCNLGAVDVLLAWGVANYNAIVADQEKEEAALSSRSDVYRAAMDLEKAQNLSTQATTAQSIRQREDAKKKQQLTNIMVGAAVLISGYLLLR